MLLLVNQCNLLDVLTWVDEKDDVCLLDSSPELIAHRARWLGRSIEGTLDPLTRVLSRQKFDQRLVNACKESSPNHPVSLILGDPKFHFGHVILKELWSAAAERISRGTM